MSRDEKAEEMVKEATVQIRKTSANGNITIKMAIVRCNNFRCLGIMGSDGAWKDSGGRPLEVLEVVTEF